MRIIGIDPGLATIGLGVIDADGSNINQVVDWCTIKTLAGLPISERLKIIHEDLSEYIKEYKPEFCVIEKIYFQTNEKTAIDVAQARGVLLQVIASANISILEPTPLQLKSAITGDGKADKRQIQDMLIHILKLEEIPKPDDAADALALAFYGAIHGNEAMKQ
ncbi:MAG: crossover junction endodeoxyribonuclease RuvC [Candidatus Peribacteraceae bacterium]|nr:crossover junction endodeoxyribonuclease RuvC [Candidatus Peribacteraceae bacterium]